MTTVVRVGELSADLGISPSWIRKLTEKGVFETTLTQGGHRRYELPAARDAYARYRRGLSGLDGQHPIDELGVVTQTTVTARFDRELALAGLQEDQVWRDMLPNLDLDEAGLAVKAARYAFTEMLNNAIDHSRGEWVRVRAWRSDEQLTLEVADDGVGVFAHVAEGLGLPGPYAAVGELTKGKRTTAPDAHSGEGIFFTSKVVALFELASNGIVWMVDNVRNDHAFGSSSVVRGTQVRLGIDSETTVDTAEVFRRYSVDHDFVRSSPVVKLFAIGVAFVSRSEAKRLLSGMEEFAEVMVDFAGVESVGQGFVDELMRVWPTTHPGTSIRPVNMNPEVEFMVRRGLGPLPRQ